MLQRLHSVLAKKSRGHVLVLGLIATTFVVSAHFSARIVDELVDESAQSTARNWADAFVAQGADQLDKVLAGDLREIRPENKGQNQRIVWLAGPVKEVPSPYALAL